MLGMFFHEANARQGGVITSPETGSGQAGVSAGAPPKTRRDIGKQLIAGFIGVKPTSD
jgi:hypothetical protein